MSRFTNISLFLLIMTLMVSCTSSRTSLTYFEDLKGQQSGTLVSRLRYKGHTRRRALYRGKLTRARSHSRVQPAHGQSRRTRQRRHPLAAVADNIPRRQSRRHQLPGSRHTARRRTHHRADSLDNHKKVSETVEDPYVKVQLVNFKVNVLGEVARPGTIEVDTERYSLLDALAAAGDLTPYGERENILLIREENGQKHFHHLNLNDAATLSSPYFYLQQNDVIYVEPNKIRHDNSKYNQNNSYKLSVVSAVVSAVSVVASLCIALFIK